MRQPFPFQQCLAVLLFAIATPLSAQNPADPALSRLLGRWEVLRYSEQGVQVDKKQPALPQARAVYRHVRRDRARQFYGYSDYEDYSRHESRDFERWAERDSIAEVDRIAEAIELPYYAVFFADSTLALYNRDAAGQVSFPETKHFAFAPATMSVDLMTVNNPYDRWQVQVLALTATQLTLFLPETAEVVELVKTAFSLP